MKTKTIKICYWITTILFSVAMFIPGIIELMNIPSAQKSLIDLGYPAYLSYILGAAKILGVIAILQPRFKTIKEWAYAGFTIDIVGAVLSMLFVGTPVYKALPLPLLYLGIMFVSYFTGKRIDKF